MTSFELPTEPPTTGRPTNSFTNVAFSLDGAVVTSWFSKKKAPDGTHIIRHDSVERQIGFARDTGESVQIQKAAYERLYGKPESVSHELLPQIPHIDVYTIKRRPEEAKSFMCS